MFLLRTVFFRWTQVQELRREGNRKSNGGMDLAAFRHVMLRVFGIDDINDFVLQDRNSHNIDANVKVQKHVSRDAEGVVGFHVLIFICIKFLDHGLLLFFGLARSIFWDMLMFAGSKKAHSTLWIVLWQFVGRITGKSSWMFPLQGNCAISDLPSQNTSESMTLHIPNVGRYDIPNSLLCFSLDQPGSGCLWSVQCSCRPHWHQKVHDLVPGSHWELLYFHYHLPYF